MRRAIFRKQVASLGVRFRRARMIAASRLSAAQRVPRLRAIAVFFKNPTALLVRPVPARDSDPALREAQPCRRIVWQNLQRRAERLCRSIELAQFHFDRSPQIKPIEFPWFKL